jgi:ribonuclease Z
MRKALLAAIGLGLLAGIFAPAPVQAQSDFKVTLLGTASPSPRPTRFGPSTLIEAGDQKFIIDAGRGVPIRLWQLKVPMGKIDVLFITHYHSDHVSGIPDLWLTVGCRRRSASARRRSTLSARPAPRR